MRLDNITPLPAYFAKLVGEALQAISNPIREVPHCMRCDEVLPERSRYDYCGDCIRALRDGNL